MLSVHMMKHLDHFQLDIAFEVGNEIVALYGPSGSGKTTILNSIAGLTRLDDGYIRLNDRTFIEDGKALISVQERNIGYVFQSYALFPHMTVWENIAYSMKDEQMTKSLIEKLGIEHILKQYPHEVSGGEKQRTALIRALATKPELLLLDEPFSALDDETKRTSIEQLLMIHKDWNIPIIFVSHIREEVELLASRVLHIQDGKLQEKL